MFGSRFSFLACALLISTLFCVSVARQSGERGEEEEPGATYAEGALQWRLMTLRGPDGRIPPDGLLRAREHVQRMRGRRQRLDAAAALGAPEAGAQPLAAQGQRGDNWRWLGPGNIGGRVRAIVIHPTHPDTMFAGGVSGGIWRSDDAGGIWTPPSCPSRATAK